MSFVKENVHPKAFISYAWEDETKAWVKALATQLRGDGIDITIDQWAAKPGDQMPHFMEQSVRENDYVLIICTPKYKEKSDNRQGGVGYEGDIMTAEVFQKGNHSKYIPILQSGTKETSLPSWLAGKYFIDLSAGQPYEEHYKDLVTTIYKAREAAPPLGQRPAYVSNAPLPTPIAATPTEEIRIKGILADEVTTPRNDGTKGSALYSIPFELNKRPTSEWAELFIQSWNYPPQFTTMHRPGIASVSGKKIILNGTTIDEVERYHRDTLKLCVAEANKKYHQIIEHKRSLEELKRREEDEHKRNIDDISRRISFE